MDYAEFHFSSEGEQRSHRSTRSRPVFELNETIIPRKFALKSLSLPLTWCNAGGSGTMEFFMSDATSRIHTFTLAKACYASANAFTTALQGAMQAATGTSNLDLSNIEVYYETSGYASFVFPDATIGTEGPLTVTSIVITWKDGLEKIFNRDWNLPPTLTIPGLDNINRTSSFYPIRLVPNFVYLHSNLMSGTRYGRNMLSEGGHKSSTILAKIPINYSLLFGQQVQIFVNETLHPNFMFTSDSAFQTIEFWFTDDITGEELDFRNISFSLSLAMNW